jgi:hypothetical protein
MSIEQRAPRLRPDFAQRVMREVRVVQRRQRERRRLALSMGAFVMLIAGVWSVAANPRPQPVHRVAIVIGDTEDATVDGVFALEDLADTSDDPAAFFFPDDSDSEAYARAQ